MTAHAFRPASPEDIYNGLDSTDESVPSCRRITVRVGRPKALPRDVRDAQTEPPANPPAYQPTVAADENAMIPEHSVRRMRAAKVPSVRVAGAPDSIEEPVTEAMLRDPRRE
jgi:hypothetical protein